MGNVAILLNKVYQSILLLMIMSACTSLNKQSSGNLTSPDLEYKVSMEKQSTHNFHVDMFCSGWIKDTIDLKMARWMPGYYQIMDYANGVNDLSADDINGKSIPVTKANDNTWRIAAGKTSPFRVSYDVRADRRFVANNYLDSTHGYIIPESTFLYIKDLINKPVQVKVIINSKWSRIATGLDILPGKTNEFMASDFDELFDCPILAGDLEEFPSFEIYGIRHRFIGYNPGNFDRAEFMATLQKVVKAGVDIFGDIPYKQFTFIGIGPGYGGIEHSNNTTVSFNVSGFERKGSMSRMMSFLAHEYFHNYNVKRIRPYELGPFDYDKENRTNLLWVSEGLSVYYEYLMIKRAGLITDQELFSDIESNINALENDPGRHFQSLIQSSYSTWSDGPFGNRGMGADSSISYYDKGPIIGLILDLSIRNATGNKKSLDDVMRILYVQYYKNQKRGFTDAEFQQTAESVSGVSLSAEFEYVYTTREIDYNRYLSFAGLKISETTDRVNGKRKFFISKLEKTNSGQDAILHSWSGD
jgi:predicted metalloprotease with PDZ domain